MLSREISKTLKNDYVAQSDYVTQSDYGDWCLKNYHYGDLFNYASNLYVMTDSGVQQNIKNKPKAKPQKQKKSAIIPSCFTDFANGMIDNEASVKLLKKIKSLASAYDNHHVYLTKIAYYVDSETKIPRLVFTDRIGKESFDVLSGNIEELVQTTQKDKNGNGIVLYAIALKDVLDKKELDLLEKYNDYCLKKISKDEAKKLVSTKFKIGDVIALRSKIRDGSKKNFKKFIVKKIIWSINSNPVNIIVAKQISGKVTNMSLTKADCKKYHIKYEENLQVYSMFMNFIKIKQ